MWDLIFNTLLPMAPGVGAVLWLAFKAYAERTDNTTDDKIVEFIEEVAAGVFAKEQAKAADAAIEAADADAIAQGNEPT